MARIKDKAAVRTRQSAKPKQTPNQAALSDARVTRFPQLRGKVIRVMRFTHHDCDNVLVIHFTDGSFLVFDIDPEPLFLPLSIDAHYVRGSGRKTHARTWPGLAEDKRGRNG